MTKQDQLVLLKDIQHALNMIPRTGFRDRQGERSDTYKLASRLDDLLRDMTED